MSGSTYLDVGFAFDGDADRCLAVDERGEVLNGDKIMYICAKFLKERGQLPGNTLVTTVMSNFGLYKALDKAGIRYEKTAVGDRYVYENMKENVYVLGGEQSGHIIFRKYAHTGDGLITALMLMEVMMETQLPLSVLASGVSMYPQVLKNVRWMIKTLRFRTAPCRRRWTNAPPHWGISGRVLLRKSGTEPVLRVMAEAGTAEECEKWVDHIIAAMEKSGPFDRGEEVMLTVKELYSLEHSLAGVYLSKFTYPWEALAGISDLILEIGKQLPEDEYVHPTDWDGNVLEDVLGGEGRPWCSRAHISTAPVSSATARGPSVRLYPGQCAGGE